MEKTQVEPEIIPPAVDHDASSKSSKDANDDPKTDYSSKATNKTSFSDYAVSCSVG